MYNTCMWFFKRKKKIDATGAIVLTKKEYQTISELNPSDPKVRLLLDIKGIKLDSGNIKVTVGGETFLMSTSVAKLGLKLLD